MSNRFPADDEHLHPYPGNLKQHKVMTPDAHSRSYLSALNADYDDAIASKASSPWISVNDRLPPTERVLVYSQYSGVDAGYYQPSIDKWTDSMFFDFVASDCKLFKDVTHWMPLPESPKK